MPLGFERINERTTRPNPLINFIKPLETSDEALARDFLERVAAICYPIMKAHHIAVMSLEEYPPNLEFVGRNFNAGEVIQLVLKAPSTGQWLPFRYVQGVMMHELAHFNNTYRSDLKALWEKDYTGEGLWGRGQTLLSGQYSTNAMPETELQVQSLCGGTYRSSRGKKRRRASDKPKLSYAERQQRRIEKKFGKHGTALGDDESVKARLEGGKRVVSKPKQARATVEDEAVKKEPADESESDSDYEDGDLGSEATDAQGKRILDDHGNRMLKVCEDEDPADEEVKRELAELREFYQGPTAAPKRVPTPQKRSSSARHTISNVPLDDSSTASELSDDNEGTAALSTAPTNLEKTTNPHPLRSRPPPSPRPQHPEPHSKHPGSSAPTSTTTASASPTTYTTPATSIIPTPAPQPSLCSIVAACAKGKLSRAAAARAHSHLELHLHPPKIIPTRDNEFLTRLNVPDGAPPSTLTAHTGAVTSPTIPRSAPHGNTSTRCSTQELRDNGRVEGEKWRSEEPGADAYGKDADTAQREGTFIMPHGKNRPAIYTDPRGRLKLEWKRLKQRFMDSLGSARRSIALYKWWYVKPAPKLDVRKVSKIATDLHRRMYEQFAAGNVESLRPCLCESISDSLSQRIASRPTNTYLDWKLHRYVGSPRLASYRATLLMMNDDKEKQTTVQQAVVRIRSVQSLRRVKRERQRDGSVREVTDEGSVVGSGVGGANAGEGKDVTEYFVVQKMIRKGVEGQRRELGLD
ncbi:hypothetical protein H2203_005488 [Taxawa tesnikishii (nom. ined.)]|nr:hypothetical protein H2203_005488 [Dothideales sp. JES 119]